MHYLKSYFKNKKNIKWYIFFLLLLTEICVQYLLAKDGDLDFIWHYKTGERIAIEHKIPMDNSFTWQTGTTWNQHEWLFDVIFYSFVKCFGLFGDLGLWYLINAIGVTACLAIAKPKHPNLFLFITAFTMIIMNTVPSCRPSLLTNYLFAFWVWLYYKNKDTMKRLVVSAIMGLFIANFHGGNIGFFVVIYLILIVIDIVFDLRNGESSLNKYRTAFGCILVFLGASCMCPLGYKIITNSLDISGLESTGYINEWQPKGFGYTEACVYLAIIISFGYTIYKNKFDRKQTSQILIVTALAVLSMVITRCTQQFWIAWVCLGMQYTLDFFYDFFLAFKRGIKRWLMILKSKDGTIDEAALNAVKPKKRKEANAVFVACIFSAVYTLFACMTYTVYSQSKYKTFNDLVDGRVSKTCLEAIEKNYVDGETKILNPYSDGNVLIYHNIKVFCDSRQSPYDNDTNNSLITLMKLGRKTKDEIDADFKKYDFNMVWTTTELPLDMYMETRDDFKRIAYDKDKKSSVYIKIDKDGK